MSSASRPDTSCSARSRYLRSLIRLLVAVAAFLAAYGTFVLGIGLP